jgi:hypothetical protein
MSLEPELSVAGTYKTDGRFCLDAEGALSLAHPRRRSMQLAEWAAVTQMHVCAGYAFAGSSMRRN